MCSTVRSCDNVESACIGGPETFPIDRVVADLAERLGAVLRQLSWALTSAHRPRRLAPDAIPREVLPGAA